MSERRACRALGQHRSTQRKVPQGRADEERLTDPDRATFLQFTSEGGSNYGSYDNPDVDRLLEEARVAGYDSSQVAFYYAKALNTIGQYDEAVHYADIAVEKSEGQPDRSAFFIQLGIAQRGTGNSDEARESFNAAKEGSWAAWAEYYLNEMDSEAAGG